MVTLDGILHTIVNVRSILAVSFLGGRATPRTETCMRKGHHAGCQRTKYAVVADYSQIEGRVHHASGGMPTPALTEPKEWATPLGHPIAPTISSPPLDRSC